METRKLGVGWIALSATVYRGLICDAATVRGCNAVGDIARAGDVISCFQQVWTSIPVPNMHRQLGLDKTLNLKKYMLV